MDKKKTIDSFLRKHYKTIVFVFVLLAIPSVYLFVYLTGGIKYVFSHTMYIPIIVTGIVFGGHFGLLVGALCGILLGPFMPLVVETGEAQDVFNWIYRLVIFIIVGGLAGYFSDFLRKALKINRELSRINHETKVFNTNYLLEMEDSHQLFSVVTLIVSDRRQICDVFGFEVFNRIMFEVFNILNKKLPANTIIVQSDSHKLWILHPSGNSLAVADELVAALQEPIAINGVNIYVEYYLGVEDLHTLTECKTLKPFGESDRYARYAEINNLPYASINQYKYRKRLHFDLLSQFKEAMANKEMYLAYHPIVNLKTMEIAGLEALSRWQHPTKGNIPPIDFISIIEQTQLIHPLLEWVLDNAIKKLEDFKEVGIKLPVSINLSAKNFIDPLLYKKLTEAFQMKDFSCTQLIVEITETVLMDNIESTQVIVNRLMQAGIGVAIDDFGKGYSSLSYLSQLQIDYMKIDRYFISKIKDLSTHKIIKAAIDLAHQLGYKVIAEGIEDKATLKEVIKLGCDFAQGFYFCKPVHEDEIVAYYQKNHHYEFDIEKD